jgi:hypothetical protein
VAAATAEHFSTVTLAALGAQREFLRCTLKNAPAAPRDRYGKFGSGLSFNAADTPLRFVSCGS